MEACKHYYSVRYVRLPDLLLDLQAARDNGTFSTVLKKYTKPIVLIIDEWLLLKLTEAEARNLFELIHKRRKKSSTIFCSQFRESEWCQQICDGESTLADAIMYRTLTNPKFLRGLTHSGFMFDDIICNFYCPLLNIIFHKNNPCINCFLQSIQGHFDVCLHFPFERRGSPAKKSHSPSP